MHVTDFLLPSLPSSFPHAFLLPSQPSSFPHSLPPFLTSFFLPLLSSSFPHFLFPFLAAFLLSSLFTSILMSSSSKWFPLLSLPILVPFFTFTSHFLSPMVLVPSDKGVLSRIVVVLKVSCFCTLLNLPVPKWKKQSNNFFVGRGGEDYRNATRGI